MEEKNVHSGKGWRITRTYTGQFSCGEVIEKLIKAHLETEENEDVKEKYALSTS